MTIKRAVVHESWRKVVQEGQAACGLSGRITLRPGTRWKFPHMATKRDDLTVPERMLAPRSIVLRLETAGQRRVGRKVAGKKEAERGDERGGELEVEEEEMVAIQGTRARLDGAGLVARVNGKYNSAVAFSNRFAFHSERWKSNIRFNKSTEVPSAFCGRLNDDDEVKTTEGEPVEHLAAYTEVNRS
ncbi:hypothetical protein K0M31_002162 [Melipona bicolor]|uniref:Uncharacterized protein n=1 Tax=Melipona bicolor TaxID=60889 RepID=A0AA40GHP8_9HYME|nr:hypothetical protein K0M31_002162 [Melipona bicolor]